MQHVIWGWGKAQYLYIVLQLHAELMHIACKVNQPSCTSCGLTKLLYCGVGSD